MARIVFTPMSAEAWALNSKAKTLNGTITVSELTSGRVVFAGTGGLLSDDADFTFSVDTLTVTKIATTAFTGDITMESSLKVRSSVDNSQIGFYGGSVYNTGGYLAVYGEDEGATPGDALIVLGGSKQAGAFGEFLLKRRTSGGLTTLLTVDISNVFTFTGDVELDADLNHDGSNVGFYAVAPVARSASWTITNDLADRAFDADTVAVAELADVVATLITDLAATGIIGASA